MKKTIYQRFYNRFLPLMSVEEWYQGEHFVLPKFLNLKIYFNHLFVYRFGKGTDVYYEPSIPRVKQLIDYFNKNPERLKEMSKDCDFLAKEIKSLCKKARFNDIKKFRKIIIEKVWPIITISVVLGLYSDEFGVKKLEKLGVELRKKSDTLLYKAGWKLWELAKEKFSKIENYIDYLSFKEVISGKIPSIKELEKRRQGYIYFNGRLYVGKSLEQFIKENNIKLIDETSEFKDNNIKGTIAMTGKVTGRVKLVFEIPQLENVKQGDIFVTSMTVPDFLPAMKRAAAFVTDEGGITCHAAIVAREMKKPCIIGTKIATNILKDGDIIEVDAINGIVRIIKQ